MEGAIEEKFSQRRPFVPNDLCCVINLTPPFRQLILDLDETLVHSSFKPVLGADIVMDIDVEGTRYKVFIALGT